MLICPKCKKTLIKDNHSYKCEAGHSYDIAKSGYINLLISRSGSGDCKEMVDARNSFLPKGYYDIIPDKILEILSNYNIRKNEYILDGGCGTGYYDSLIKRQYPNIIGFDISKDAVLKASKNNPDLLYMVASSYAIPIMDNSISCLINIFAPTSELESYRVLKDDGLLIVVTPGEEHLIELKQALYDSPYLNKQTNPKVDHLTLVDTIDISKSQKVANDDLINITKMTPYFYKTNQDNLERLQRIDNLDLTISFRIYVYKKNKLL